MKKTLFVAFAVVTFAFSALADSSTHHVTDTKLEQTTSETKTTVDAKAAAVTTKSEKKMPEMTLPPGVTAEQMAEAMKLGAPSEAHKKLDAFAGKWNFTTKFWMDPKKKPEVMKGTAEHNWILGGRFLMANAKGEENKDWPAFEGMGLTGYDNVKKEYTSMWVDNMSTSTMKSTATFDDKAKTLTEKGTYNCPMKQAEQAYRSVWKIKGKDAFQYVSYMTDMNGKEYKAMEIEYKRAK
jgi:hypothetical protein